MTERIFQASAAAFEHLLALRIADELKLPLPGVKAVMQLTAENATVPFIARYRKEVTGGLDEVQIRDIQEKRVYIVELEERRAAILKSIDEQGKLTPELRKLIEAATAKAMLEDLYLPYKPKRRTRAMIAKERGLEPLGLMLLAQEDTDPRVAAAAFVDADKEVPSVEEALAGARDIAAESMAEHASVRAMVREAFDKEGEVVTEGVPDKIKVPTKFEQYYDFHEPIRAIPSHRFLAIRRGEKEGVLRADLRVNPDLVLPRMLAIMGQKNKSPWAAQMQQSAEDAWKRLIQPSVENDVRIDLKLKSDRGAVDVFADNLKHLLLAAPLGGKRVLGIDPGLRTGCKCAAVDETGKFLEYATIFLSQGEHQAREAARTLITLVVKHSPTAVAVGNGTAGRETEVFVKNTLKEANLSHVTVVPVSEAGASVYSASDVAREEFPDLDLTIRGAISIARRLQDPLAELVKVDPKSIGVGQYQHDVHQPMLARKLGEVVESCVNRVGVELNTASAPLLGYVAGIGESLAKRIVKHREEKGAFKKRGDVMLVTGLGPKAFEQCAGFLRIAGAENPLDESSVHPERYALVDAIAKDMALSVRELVGNAQLAATIPIAKYVSTEIGEPTLRDIVAELKKPGRDPRETFEPPKFRDDVMSIGDLKEGMILEGVVTNVAAFGAFVDIGVHQDGLIHVSKLSDRFITDPKEVVKVGDRLKVKVMEVDGARKRISLSARMSDEPGGDRAGNNRGGAPQARTGSAGPRTGGKPGQNDNKGDRAQFANNPFAKLLK